MMDSLQQFSGSSPRVRGTLFMRTTGFMHAIGSSPRVRGTHSRPRSARSRIPRFIPACAGNADAAMRLRPANRFIPACAGNACAAAAHERQSRFIPACAGNAVAAMRSMCPSAGSSPRVRGTLDRADPDRQTRRFIPACAGNALSVSTQSCARRFIPACAGNASRALQRDAQQSGSSPRVRGTRAPDATHLVAAAGSSPRVRGTL